ncbi:hypothetical protein [Dyadobacter sp. CY327]
MLTALLFLMTRVHQKLC